MPQDKAPAFQFYPKDFLTDERVGLMSHTERGIYVTLLCLCWLEESLPADLSQLARLVNVKAGQFERLWSGGTLPACFMEVDGRLRHPRLDFERDKQDAYRRRQSDRGKASGVVRSETNRRSTASGSTSVQPEAVQPEANSSSPICNLQSPVSDLQKKSGGGSKRPIYTSDRFAVFEWQLDELGRVLGPHLNDFDLHAFFDDLSQKSRADGLVIPKEKLWEWLQSQVLSEARRRGLPIATVEQTVPTNKRIAGLVTGGEAFLKRNQA